LTARSRGRLLILSMRRRLNHFQPVTLPHGSQENPQKSEEAGNWIPRRKGDIPNPASGRRSTRTQAWCRTITVRRKIDEDQYDRALGSSIKLGQHRTDLSHVGYADEKQQSKKITREEIFVALSGSQIGPGSKWDSHPLPVSRTLPFFVIL